MTKHPIEVITSVERRRRWSREDKERLVAACLEPGAVLSEIARAAGIHVSQLFRWRKELCRIEERSLKLAKHLGARDRVGGRVGSPARRLRSASRAATPSEA
jgi:transposase